MPAGPDGLPQHLEHAARHVGVPDDAMRLVDQFGFAVTGHLAEKRVSIGDTPLPIGLRNDQFGGGEEGLATGWIDVFGHRRCPSAAFPHGMRASKELGPVVI